MLDVFGALNNRLLKISTVNIDNHVFKLHYRATVILMIAFSLLVTSRQYIGDPISCMSTASDLPRNVLDQYCWVSTTFSLPAAFDKRVGVDVPYPGIDRSTPEEKRIYHQYYQWVCFVLFLQAIMFYLPHYLWKVWEGGRLRSLALGLEIPILTENAMEAKKEVLVYYFTRNLHNHNFYFAKFFLCEILNFVNVIGQIYFTNKFLGGAFTTYGPELIRYSESLTQNNRTDPLVKVFPRITKCIFYTFGASGEVQKHDALCVLPINIINEKIYVFLWFWFVILTALSGLTILYRILTCVLPRVRFLMLSMVSRFSPSEYVDAINSKFQVGDWFLLYQLGACIESQCFSKIISALAKSIDGKNGQGTKNAENTKV